MQVQGQLPLQSRSRKSAEFDAKPPFVAALPDWLARPASDTTLTQMPV